MATPRLGLVVEDKPTELSCIISCTVKAIGCTYMYRKVYKSSSSTTNPKPRGNHPSACSGAPIFSCKRQSHLGVVG